MHVHSPPFSPPLPPRLGLLPRRLHVQVGHSHRSAMRYQRNGKPGPPPPAMSLRMRPKARGVGMQGMAGGIGRATVSLGATARGPASSPLGIPQPSGLRNPQVDASRAPRYLLHPFPLVEKLSGRVAMSESPHPPIPSGPRALGPPGPDRQGASPQLLSGGSGAALHASINTTGRGTRRGGSSPWCSSRRGDLTMSGHRRHRRGRGEDLQLGGAMISPYGSLVALEKA
ncbi:unnamed protein product [Diplocarpon coronariae]